jgi:hypothetical protein
MCTGVALQVKIQFSLVNCSKLKEICVTHVMRPVSLPNDTVTLLHAELNKQLVKLTYLKGLTLPSQRSEMNQLFIICTVYTIRV